MQLIETLTVDIHRLGSLSEEGIIRRGESYIALTGSNAPPTQCTMKLGHEDFLRLLYKLRYPNSPNVTPDQVAEALKVAGCRATDLLPDLHTGENEPLQVDLVLGAAELWAFPFEACTVDDLAIFADSRHPLILTRRIRQGFAAEKQAWPVKPRILFLHAPATQDLSMELIERHKSALVQALMPWSAKGDPQADGLLAVELTLGIGDVKKAMSKARKAGSPFTHVHILAHGAPIVDPAINTVRWGLRLGYEAQPASDPEEVARVLQPQDGLPVVVTVAACDAANQAETAVPRKGFAQELHRRGIPVVIASQLPLTQPGSVTMTRAFYNQLLRGEDVRWALHRTRLALHGDRGNGHDWVSMVGYVQLPEGYADHLMEVGVKHEIELLKAARKKLDEVDVAETDGLSGELELILEGIQREVSNRIASLNQRLEIIPKNRDDLRSECHGILASAHKRLAELLFRRSIRAGQADDPEEKRRYENSSKVSLQESLQNYRSAFRARIQNHWLGVQQLALEAVISGKIKARDWDTTLYAAELALASNRKEYWAFGTIAELWLLAPVLGKPGELEQAKKALQQLSKHAKDANDADAVLSTRDQLNRYVTWWTKDRGFFGKRDDLANNAAVLIQYLDNARESEQ